MGIISNIMQKITYKRKTSNPKNKNNKPSTKPSIVQNTNKKQNNTYTSSNSHNTYPHNDDSQVIGLLWAAGYQTTNEDINHSTKTNSSYCGFDEDRNSKYSNYESQCTASSSNTSGSYSSSSSDSSSGSTE